MSVSQGCTVGSGKDITGHSTPVSSLIEMNSQLTLKVCYFFSFSDLILLLKETEEFFDGLFKSIDQSANK